MDPQLLRRGGQRRERKTANVETVCECVRDGPGSSGCPILNISPQTIIWINIQTCVAWQFFSLPLTASMFADMQRKLRLNIYPQPIVWVNIQTHVAW